VLKSRIANLQTPKPHSVRRGELIERIGIGLREGSSPPRLMTAAAELEIGLAAYDTAEYLAKACSAPAG
jgi:hypothetical protein